MEADSAASPLTEKEIQERVPSYEWVFTTTRSDEKVTVEETIKQCEGYRYRFSIYSNNPIPWNGCFILWDEELLYSEEDYFVVEDEDGNDKVIMLYTIEALPEREKKENNSWWHPLSGYSNSWNNWDYGKNRTHMTLVEEEVIIADRSATHYTGKTRVNGGDIVTELWVDNEFGLVLKYTCDYFGGAYHCYETTRLVIGEVMPENIFDRSLCVITRNDTDAEATVVDPLDVVVHYGVGVSYLYQQYGKQYVIDNWLPYLIENVGSQKLIRGGMDPTLFLDIDRQAIIDVFYMDQVCEYLALICEVYDIDPYLFEDYMPPEDFADLLNELGQ